MPPGAKKHQESYTYQLLPPTTVERAGHAQPEASSAKLAIGKSLLRKRMRSWPYNKITMSHQIQLKYALSQSESQWMSCVAYTLPSV